MIKGNCTKCGSQALGKVQFFWDVTVLLYWDIYGPFFEMRLF